MATATVETRDRAIQASQGFLQSLLAGLPNRTFAVEFWDGTRWEATSGAPPSFMLKLKHPGALKSMFWPPDDLAMGEAYIYDDFDIGGSIEAVFPVVDELVSGGEHGLRDKVTRAKELFILPGGRHPRHDDREPDLHGKRHSIERDKQAVSFHYDRSNEFFASFLDQRMVYSCAYFQTPDQTIDNAQTDKLEHICRKLRLQPGERLLDIGCGWGGLVMYAAQHYGVDATGITLSKRQAEFASERIRTAGLEGRCRVELLDYREVTGQERFDKLVSIGMFEHVGEAQLPAYFAQAMRLLKTGGVFLNHGICRNWHQSPRSGRSFLAKHVWPDGELETISTTLTAAERTGFEVRDVESLREHYTLTLRQWVRRLEANAAAAIAATDDVAYRTWRLYMAGSAYSFAKGDITLFQTLLAKPDQGVSGLPLTRQDWYR